MRNLVLLVICFFTACSSIKKEEKTIIYFTDFNISKELELWFPEVEGAAEQLAIINGVMDINVAGGATIWFKERLVAPVEIEYTVKVIDEGGENDRVSDLNCFWMANDPRCLDNIFSCEDSIRKGPFKDYHNLKTYYVGYGGHNNSKTRFRRYLGTGERPLLAEHDLSEPLISPNEEHKIRISVKNGRTTYSVDGQILFDVTDEAPYEEGWFAFRTVRNHMQVKDFTVWEINE